MVKDAVLWCYVFVKQSYGGGSNVMVEEAVLLWRK